jgi:hypothetical protein
LRSLRSHRYTIEQSRDISKAYGSDRGAQSYPLSTQWMAIAAGAGGVGSERVMAQVAKSVALIEHELMEEKRNVHNKFMLVYPLVALELEGDGDGDSARLWEEEILKPFDEYYGGDAKVFFKTLYKPVWWLLCLRAGGGRGAGIRDEAGAWLRECSEGGEIVGGSKLLETVLVLLGRSFTSLAAEIGICYLRGRETAEEGGVKGWVKGLLVVALAAAKDEKGLLWELKACERLQKEMNEL